MEYIGNTNAAQMESIQGAMVFPDEGIDRIDAVAIYTWFTSRLRIFFYLSSPCEESFEFDHQVPDYFTEVYPFVLSFVFIEWFILWFQEKPIPLIGDSFASTSMSIIMECIRFFTRGIEHTAYIYIYQHYRLVDLPWNSLPTWYLTAVLMDFGFYWAHRASHGISFLWAHHQAHHNSESFTFVNTFRLPFVNGFLSSPFHLPLAFFISPAYYLVHVQLNAIFQFTVHTEVIGKLGPLEKIFNTPNNHRIHHGSNKFCLDKNFGGWLIIWDRMFGTFQEMKEDEEIVYGLVDQPKSFNPFYLQMFYFKELYDKWCSMDGWKNKLSSLIKGPGWRPGSPWTGFVDEIPDVVGRKQHAYEPFPLWKIVYFFIHFFLVIFIFMFVALIRERMSLFAVCAHLFYVLLSLTTISMFFDGCRLAPILEFSRCFFAFVYCAQGDEIPILSDSLSQLGLRESLRPSSLETGTCYVLCCYYFFSASFWVSIKPICKMMEQCLTSKIKNCLFDPNHDGELTGHFNKME